MTNRPRRQQNDRSNNPRNSEARVDWERGVQSFSKDGYTAQIDRLPLPVPRFSVSFGILRGEGGPDSFTSRIACRYHLADGVVAFEALPPPGVLDQLLDQAAEWIEKEILANEERRSSQ